MVDRVAMQQWMHTLARRPIRLCLGALALLALLPAAAFAQGGIDINTCAPGFQPWQITGIVVFCVESAIINAEVTFITMLTQALQGTIAALFVLAGVFFGMRVLMGEPQILKFAAGFMLRFALVVGIVFNLSSFALVPFQMVEQALSVVCGGWSPWGQIDFTIATLFGFAPGIALFQGLLGILGAALFSSATGMYLFLFAFLAILSMLGFMFRAVYTFLLAVVMMGFLMAVSPLVVPLAIMGITERYFTRWLQLMMSAILQQFMVFAFLWYFLSMVSSFVGMILGLLGGNDFSAFWRTSVPFFSWAMVSDPNLFQNMEAQGFTKGSPLVQAVMNPLLGRSMDIGILTHPGVDFGPNQFDLVQQLITTFAPMALTCYLLRAMLEAIPHLSDQIAGAATGLGFERIEFVDTLKQAIGGMTAGKLG